MLPPMLGTLLNVGGILVGATFGLAGRAALSPATESFFRLLLAAFTVFFGARISWQSYGGSASGVLKQLLIVVAGLLLGNVFGRLLRLQKFSNQIGQAAREWIAAATGNAPRLPDAGFKTCAALFCAAPLGIIGAVVDGFSIVPGGAVVHENIGPLVIKALMDGLAAMGFARIFGWSVLLSALPVLAWQGTLALLCARVLGAVLAAHNLVNPINAAAGLLLFCVALVMLGLKRVPLADYLPTLIVAPLLAWWWHW
jgi:uncharacterized membrane protein YqgA involved in biofilm formation